MGIEVNGELPFKGGIGIFSVPIMILYQRPDKARGPLPPLDPVRGNPTSERLGMKNSRSWGVQAPDQVYPIQLWH